MDNTQAAPANAGAEAQPIADANLIDSIIDNAATETPEPKPETPEDKEAKEGEEKEHKEVWPKKAENALAREKGKTARLKFERDQLRAAHAELEKKLTQYTQTKPTQSQANTGEPKESDFNNYAEYMRAVQKYDLQQEISKLEGKQQETHRNTQEQAWIAERERAVAIKAQEFAKENPDLLQLVEEYGDVIDEFSPQLQKLFLEADNAPLAFFNLVKEGKLESLSTMSLAKAAMEIGRAQTQAPTKPKPVTNAPAPMAPAKGTGSGGKTPDRMTTAELLKWQANSA